MNPIEKVVQSARQRLWLGHFGRSWAISTFIAFVVAAVAIAIPAMWVMDVQWEVWQWSWVIGAAVFGVLVAAIVATTKTPTSQEVAVEVDRRFQTRDRLTSSMTISDVDEVSDFGQALKSDAQQKAEALKAAEQFELRPQRIAWLPALVIPVLVGLITLLEPAKATQADSAPTTEPVEVKNVVSIAKQLKKKIAQQKRKAEAKGLEDAKEMFEKLEQDLDKLASRKGLNKKDAMIAMNDLKKELEERRKQLGSSDQMRKMMSQMNGVQSGPGEKIAKSIQRGDFQKAKEMINALSKKLKDGKLSDKEEEQLKKQVQQMAKAMKDAIKKQEQKKKDLERQIQQAKKEGRQADAQKMQEKLDQMNQQQNQMNQMKQMAESMQQAAKAMQQGDSAEAAKAMEQMAEQLGDMQQEMDELEDLDSTLDELSQSKQQMRCKNCNGSGCQNCQGMGQFGQNGQGQRQGQGMGRGPGGGDRPESEDDTNTYQSQVRGDVKRGKAVISGYADGPNRKGVTRESVKQVVQDSLSEESDASESQILPKTEREHARQYFNELRKQ